MEKIQQIKEAINPKKYIPINDQKWFDFIESGCVIRWLRKGKETNIDRFNMGGFMLRRVLDKDGDKCFVVGNRRGAKVGGVGPDGTADVVQVIKFDDIELLYKHISVHAFVEISLMKDKLEAMEKKIAALSDALDGQSNSPGN